jgi:hypothetical protein
MPDIKKTFEKIRFLKNGEALLALVFVLAGVMICWDGAANLMALWKLVRPHFPLALPEQVADQVLGQLPFIFSRFVSTVGSLSAVILGTLWVFSGLGTLFQAGKSEYKPGNPERAPLVAESLRLGQPVYWKYTTRVFRLLGRAIPRMRSMSPLAYERLKQRLSACFKLVFLGVGIGLLFWGIRMVPTVLHTYARLDVSLTVPSPRPLYGILAFLVLFNLILALSLLPFRRPQFFRSTRSVDVFGPGDPHLFFALVEESCRLLGNGGTLDKPSLRFQRTDGVESLGTLVERFPDRARFFPPIGGYLALPVIFLLLTMGFSRLIHFNRPVQPLGHIDFLTNHAFDFCLEAAFAVAMIVSGAYIAQIARQFMATRTYRSALVFCCVSPQHYHTSQMVDQKAKLRSKGGSKGGEWTEAEGVGEAFERWAGSPESEKPFSVEAFWGQALSESAEEDGPRYVVDVQTSPPLDYAVQRILGLPFRVRFRHDPRAEDTAVVFVPQSAPLPEHDV